MNERARASGLMKRRAPAGPQVNLSLFPPPLSSLLL
jgi:hypothetical protein